MYTYTDRYPTTDKSSLLFMFTDLFQHSMNLRNKIYSKYLFYTDVRHCKVTHTSSVLYLRKILTLDFILQSEVTLNIITKETHIPRSFTMTGVPTIWLETNRSMLIIFSHYTLTVNRSPEYSYFCHCVTLSLPL